MAVTATVEKTIGNSDSPLKLDAAVIGAGVAGLYQLHLLRSQGLAVKAFDAASDVGGTWYWNRYPGARFDSEGYIYQYLFSEDLYKGWSWSEKFPGQPEIERWMHYVADQLDLRKDVQFDTTIKSAHFDEATERWTITTDKGQVIDAQFLVTCCGMLSAPLTSLFPGQETFKGKLLYTARWPKDPIDFTGKRVGIVGIGATGIQVIQTIADKVGCLTVFVRTPQYVLPMKNPKYTPAEQEAYKSKFDWLAQRLPHTFTGFEHDFENTWAELTPEQRRQVLEDIWQDGSLKLWLASFAELFSDEDASEQISEFVREKMRARLKDPRLHDILIPKDYGFGSHRVPLEVGFLEAFHRPNVDVVSVKDNPIERVTPKRAATRGRRRICVRLFDLRHRLRRGYGRADAHRHSWPQRTVAEGGLEPRHPDHHGAAGARLPQPVHDRGAARALGRALQHDHLPAAAGGVDQQVHPLHARPQSEGLRADQGDGGSVGRAPRTDRRSHARGQDQLLVHGVQREG